MSFVRFESLSVWVPLGATGAAFCPGLSTFGNAMSFKPLKTDAALEIHTHEVTGSSPVGPISNQ